MRSIRRFVQEREREMESSKDKVELIQQAIQQLIMEEEEENKNRNNEKRPSSGKSFVAVDDDGEDEDHRLLLLTRLLSKVETLRADEKLQQPEPAFDAKEEVVSHAVGKVEPISETENKVDGGSCGIDGEEIVRELKKVKRQNFITHCLLSVLVVVIVGWQLSEVSLILKVKDGMRHPFRSFGSMITGMLQGPKMNGQDGGKQSFTKQKPIDASSLPGLKIPELPHMELLAFDLSNGEK